MDASQDLIECANCHQNCGLAIYQQFCEKTMQYITYCLKCVKEGLIETKDKDIINERHR
jgi:hypothetical protein